MSHYQRVISEDHYAEISNSSNGTVEFRLFDCNIPQASLVCAWVLVEIAKKALRRNSNDGLGDIDFRAYDVERGRALRYGLISLDVTSYLKRLKELIGGVEIPNIPCLREALYLLARYRLNFYGVYRYSNAKPYDYCMAQYGDCSRFLENLLTISDIRHADKIREWVNEAQQIENLDQLIGLSIGVDRSLAEQLGGAEQGQVVTQPNAPPRVERALTRSQIRSLIERGSYVISRINEVNGLSTAEVAERISYLLNYHGDSMVNSVSASEVIESPFRFYVFTCLDRDSNQLQICGAVSIHIRDGQIRSLVVDRRFRRLGIARLLLNHVIRVANENNLANVYAYIRNDNEASLALFRSLGFVERDRVERAVVMVKPLRGG
jgi:ribosomal protein S18 acetylase RimI-like enzyme